MKECILCQELEPGDTLYKVSDWDGGIGYEYIRNIKYCPICGAKLIAWEERLKLIKEARKNETEGNN